MKNPLKYLRRSLSARLSLWIVLFATFVFLTALSYMFYESRRAVKEEAIKAEYRLASHPSSQCARLDVRVLSPYSGE